MTTVQQIIEAGYSRSTANDPGKLAVDLELIQQVNWKYQSVFARMAILGGDNYLARGTLILLGAPAAAALPPDLVDISRLEDSAGKKVHIVPAEQKDRLWHLPPAVFRQGLSLITLGRAGDPGVGALLTLFFLDAPATLTALASVLDSRFPVRFERLLIVDIAVYLSMKDDGRDVKEYEQLAKELEMLNKEFEEVTSGGKTAGKQ